MSQCCMGREGDNVSRGLANNDVVVTYWRDREEIINFGENIAEVLIRGYGYNPRPLSEFVRENFLSKVTKKLFGKGKLYYKILKEVDVDCMVIIGTWADQNNLGNIRAKRVLVWGAGAGAGPRLDMSDPLIKEKIKICGLRGPLTRKEIGLDDSLPIGDPGFLLPIFSLMVRASS